MIYLLKINTYQGYDTYDAKVVRAENEQEARLIANRETGDEGKVWEDSDKVQCEPLTADGPSELILGSFNAG